MPTAKAILYKRYQSKDNTYPIVIRLIDGNRQKLQPIGEKILEKYWIESGGQVSKKHPEADEINNVIDRELLKAKTYFRDCKQKGIPVDLSLAFEEVKSHSFTKYLKRRAEQYAAKGMVEMEYKTSRFYKEIVACFGREVYFHEFTPDAVRTLDIFYMTPSKLIEKPNSANTREKKFQHLKKFYNAARKEKLTTNDNPFTDYDIPTTPVKKMRLSKDQLKAIEELQLKPGAERLARDLFLFSYYCKGIRFETCITMRKEAIAGGRLHYTTNKGRKHLSTKIHRRLQEIIDRYINNDTETIIGRNRMPIEELIKDRKKYRSFIGSENAYINKGLKTVALLAGIRTPLSMHIARHSLAFHLKRTTGNVGAIKDILGHSKTVTTEKYLESLDDEFLDETMDTVYDD